MNEEINQIEVINESNPTISFKVSKPDKQKLISKASGLGLSLSEYIRLKTLLDEPELNGIIKENRELKQQVKENLVKMDLVTTSRVGTEAFQVNTTTSGMKLVIKILDEVKYQENLMPKDSIDSNFKIGRALSIIIAQQLYSSLKEMRGLRKIFGINSFKAFYRLVFDPYYTDIFAVLRPDEEIIEDFEE